MRIKHLTIDCANLQEQKYFYTRKFEFEVLDESEEHLTLKMGSTHLTFRENRLNKAYYHFALDIPYDSVNKAAKWLDKRVEIIETEDGPIKDFSSWEALAVYFLDPAGNIVEFIGRKRIKSEARTVFNEKDVINISEVGLPVNNVIETFNLIHQETGIEKFDCKSSTFCACGDDHGLFIIVDKNEKMWYPTDEAAKVFPLEVVVHGFHNKKHILRLQNGVLSFG